MDCDAWPGRLLGVVTDERAEGRQRVRAVQEVHSRRTAVGEGVLRGDGGAQPDHVLAV